MLCASSAEDAYLTRDPCFKQHKFHLGTFLLLGASGERIFCLDQGSLAFFELWAPVEWVEEGWALPENLWCRRDIQMQYPPSLLCNRTTAGGIERNKGKAMVGEGRGGGEPEEGTEPEDRSLLAPRS